MAAIRSVKRQPISAGKDRNTVVSVPTQSRHRNDMIPDIIPDINICSFNNGSLNNSTENIIRKNTAPLSLKSGGVDLVKKEKPKKLDRSQFSKEELAFIDLYHRVCLPTGLGFLPVTQRSEKLDKVLDTFAAGFDEGETFEKRLNSDVKSLGAVRAGTTR